VKYRVDSIECACDSVAIPDIADYELHFLVEIGRPRRVAMHLRDETIKGANAITRAQQLVGEMRSNESSAAGDQDSFAHGWWFEQGKFQARTAG
jgi:hypothetical protein